MINFKKWLVLIESSNPGSKTGLYSLGYGGIGLYPPQWYLTRSADAIFYMSKDDRIYNYRTKEGIYKNLNSGENGMWNISHLPSNSQKTIPDKKNGYAANKGEKGLWNIHHISSN